jgi:major membrane immunogen (membrane-anchored lipoprotein)
MKLSLKHFYYLFLLALITACSSDDAADKDLEKPTISINYDGGFPQACEELVKGETYSFRALVTDNLELASYSIDIHNNFDHHTHDDQEATCDLEDIKDPVNPLIFVENYSIEDGLTSYEFNVNITIPDDIDSGDYHCSYSITDVTGWQSITSIDIKIVE